MARRIVSEGIKDHVRISEYSDLELLGVLHDLGGIGEVESELVAKRLFGSLVADNTVAMSYAKQCVGTRMAWMARFGFTERGEIRGTWKLSREGEMLRAGGLDGGFRERIVSANGSHNELHLAHAVGERIRRTGDVGFKAMERQIRFHILQRKAQ